MCQSRSVYELLLGFHTLGDDLQIQRLAERGGCLTVDRRARMTRFRRRFVKSLVLAVQVGQFSPPIYRPNASSSILITLRDRAQCLLVL